MASQKTTYELFCDAEERGDQAEASRLDRLMCTPDEDVRCCCGSIVRKGDLERIYDDHGIYAGRACSYECGEKNLGIRLHYRREDIDEPIDEDY